jgi:hypothetical protein
VFAGPVPVLVLLRFQGGLKNPQRHQQGPVLKGPGRTNIAQREIVYDRKVLRIITRRSRWIHARVYGSTIVCSHQAHPLESAGFAWKCQAEGMRPGDPPGNH